MKQHIGNESFFDGKILDLIMVYRGMMAITLLTLGIGFPWAICLYYRYQLNHTVIGGRRLQFHGTGRDLFPNWLRWYFLIIVTFGIYSFWVSIKLEQWKVENTIYIE